MAATWSVPVAFCLLGLLSAGSAAQLDDACALAQATAHLHSVPTARPHEITNGPEIAKRMKERMMAVAESSGVMDDVAKLFDPMLSGGAASSLSLASAGRLQQALQVDHSHGIRMTRSSSFVEDGSSIRLELDKGCNTTDQLGSNNCTVHANERVNVRLSFRLAEPLDERARLSLNYSTRLIGLSAIVAPQLLGQKAKNFRVWLPNVTATCPLCGGACEMDLYGMKVRQQMPDCPIPAGEEVTVVDQALSVPRTDGLKLMQSRLHGTVAIRRPDGSLVAETSARLKIGKLDTPCNDVLNYFGKATTSSERPGAGRAQRTPGSSGWWARRDGRAMDRPARYPA
eukprot:CAMPEP_0204532338 /NCGR_PEP_ID=MMETSP0661-20131031/11670_1 /ASSEMBLY_ACC=CAM_ASM_000606 /TAXON_ID=109239 /ORGANISM="Alexandrium margalefi, Strain AMGDE01CS-322" /LENGTH=341 /DNA_ID=CAMNT_0051538569 /DNA_START=81 /DNA_END=1104 /DNA_ORIENTATION=-